MSVTLHIIKFGVFFLASLHIFKAVNQFPVAITDHQSRLLPYHEGERNRGKKPKAYMSAITVGL